MNFDDKHNLLVSDENRVFVVDQQTGEQEIVTFDPDRLLARKSARREFFRGAVVALVAAPIMWELVRPRAVLAATQLDWTAYNTPDTAVAGASMNALGGSGSYALGGAIDNTANLYTDGDLWIALSSSVAASTGSPNIAAWLLPSLDGTNYPTTNGSTTAGATATNLLAGTILVPASANVQYMALRGLLVPPSLFKIQIQNNLGVAFPATNTSVCSLYRYRLQGV